MAGGDIADFASSARRPDDFDEHWAIALAELAKVPPSIALERSALRSNDTIDTYEVHYASLQGVRIFGWLCVPRGRDQLPAVIGYPGYSAVVSPPRGRAARGYVALEISPRGHHKSDLSYAPGFPGLMTAGIDDARSYAFRALYCDAARAVDVLLRQPEVDVTRIGVTGASQGGALALATAALRPEVRAVVADVPFLTSIRDGIGLGGGAYEEVRDYIRLQPGIEARVLQTMEYIDTVNFADRVRAPTLLSVGLRDALCPPQTAYALYNKLRCPKEIRVYPDGGHEGGGAVHAEVAEAWLGQQLRGPLAS